MDLSLEVSLRHLKYQVVNFDFNLDIVKLPNENQIYFIKKL
jgi:hypothetical protein